MAMKMATVEILIEKARFEPQTAIAVAEAIDEAMDRKIETAQLVTVPVLDDRLGKMEAKLEAKLANFVTVPVLDARCAELRTEIANSKLETRHLIFATFATQVTLLLGVLYFLFNHAK